MNKEIKELVDFAINSKSAVNKKVNISTISVLEAKTLKAKTNLDLSGYTRIIDKFGINHTLKEHGNEKTERPRGLIPVTKEDFEFIPEIVKSENVIYSGKSKLGLDCLLYETIIDDIYYYIEKVRKGKKELCIKTMYKRKPITKKK
jgi:hypothetical protein